MLLYARRQEEINNWPSPLTEKVEKKLRSWEEEAVKWTAVSNGRGQFEVRWHDKQVVVNLKAKICTCRRWEITGIPCQHAIQAIGVGADCIYDYVANCYTKETAKAIYEQSISPTNGKVYWPHSELEDCGIPPIQNSKKRGRPKKHRRKRLEEAVEAKKKQKKGGREASKPEGKKYKCKVCGALGHNKAFHDPASKQKAEERKKEKAEAKRQQQLERAKRNRLAALKKQKEKAAKAAASSSSRQPPHVVQLMPDGSTRRPSSEGSQLSQIASQVTQ
ncbi:unnamed protein product [Linum trigynum]|uniref:SWIM-type domain-containing protein n=1 Tax=Linum trigynum TaxID=586398 RepID=A0AAV2EWQ4_9ROSI